MDKFKDLLAFNLKRRGLGDSLEAAKIVFEANTTIDGFRAVKYKNKTLYCEVKNGEKLLEFKINEQKYKKIINEKVGDRKVEKIIFRLERC